MVRGNLVGLFEGECDDGNFDGDDVYFTDRGDIGVFVAISDGFILFNNVGDLVGSNEEVIDGNTLDCMLDDMIGRRVESKLGYIDGSARVRLRDGFELRFVDGSDIDGNAEVGFVDGSAEVGLYEDWMVGIIVDLHDGLTVR